jgi:hypothetical protein
MPALWAPTASPAGAAADSALLRVATTESETKANPASTAADHALIAPQSGLRTPPKAEEEKKAEKKAEREAEREAEKVAEAVWVGALLWAALMG